MESVGQVGVIPLKNFEKVSDVDEIRYGAILSYANVALLFLIGLLYTPWLVNSIGADDYGLYTLAISVINFFLLDFGIGTAISRYLAKYIAEGSADKASSFLGTTYAVYCLITAIMSIVLVVVYLNIDALYSGLTEEQVQVFKAIYIVVAFYSVFSLPFTSQNGVLLANNSLIALKACSLIQKLFVTLLTILGVVFGYGVFAIVFVTAVGNLFFIVVKAILIKRLTNLRGSIRLANKRDARDLAFFTGWVSVGQVGERCSWLLMPSILGAVSGSFEIAVFGLINQIQGYIWNIADALGSLFLPKVTKLLMVDSSGKGLTGLMVRFGRIQVMIVGGIVLGFVLLGQWFVDLWIGDGYNGLWIGALAVMLVYLLSVPMQIASTAMTVSNHVDLQSKVRMAATVLTVALGVPLSSALGAFGASLAIAAGSLLSVGLNCVFYRTKLGVGLGRYFRQVYSIWLPAALAILLFFPLVIKAIPFHGWVGFTFSGGLFLLVYCALCWLFLMNDYEKSLVKSLLPIKKESE